MLSISGKNVKKISTAERRDDVAVLDAVKMRRSIRTFDGGNGFRPDCAEEIWGADQ